MCLLVYPLSHLLFCKACIVFHKFFCRIGISILTSGAYLVHLRYYGGDRGHIELHGVGLFLVVISV